MSADHPSGAADSLSYLTDGGLETTLIFHEGIELPEFAAFHLLRNEEGRSTLRNYFRKYLDIASRLQAGFILESPTWRANSDWGRKIGYSEEELESANRLSLDDLQKLREEHQVRIPRILLSGSVGPRGDGYAPSTSMSSEEAESYHSPQIRTLADGGADLVSAMTINYLDEAIGIARAAQSTGIPAVISFTTETDGCLPSGTPLQQAIEQTDQATEGSVDYFMINCAHPVHFEDAISSGDDWTKRIRGLRANASQMSHQELDESETLDEGDPDDLANHIQRLQSLLPELSVYGGCCGTDHRHVEAIGRSCLGD